MEHALNRRTRYRGDIITGEHPAIVDRTAAMLLQQAEAEVATLRASLVATEAEDPGMAQARAALAAFELVWAELTPVERVRPLRSLVDQIVIDGHTGKLAITFRASGIAALAQQSAA
jgi:hypothetical protein